MIYKYIAILHTNKFIIERFLLLGELIIGGSTVKVFRLTEWGYAHRKFFDLDVSSSPQGKARGWQKMEEWLLRKTPVVRWPPWDS